MNAARPNVADDVLAIATRLRGTIEHPELRDEVQSVVERLQGPLRVAIAGRVKAGKSTLLNALVGERLAPTDAGECTKLVTVYQHGLGYEVTAHLRGGTSRPLPFRRANGSLDVDLAGLTEPDVDHLTVGWPSSSLHAVTLIDTPGLASVNDENSRRTRTFLEPDADRAGAADAVVYLMRHAHRSDISFLDAFMDRSVAAASPVNAVAVLSRADEIGAGRLDAMSSAARIAQRYATDPQLGALCATVVPLSGLIAETGLTLREDEAAALRTLASTDADVLDRMLLSADQFCDVSASTLTAEWRRDLLDRLGVFGLRLSLDMVRSGRATTAAELGPALVDHSGLPALRRELDTRFAPRARLLQARSAIQALRVIARRLEITDPASAAVLDRDLERTEAGTLEFAMLRAEHLLRVTDLGFGDDQARQLGLLVTAPDPRTALGLEPQTPWPTVRDVALTSISRWRTRAADPLAQPAAVEVCEAATRRAESIFATAAGAGS